MQWFQYSTFTQVTFQPICARQECWLGAGTLLTKQRWQFPDLGMLRNDAGCWYSANEAEVAIPASIYLYTIYMHMDLTSLKQFSEKW